MNTLEYNLNKIIEFINNNNKGFGWKNHPNRNHNGIYVKGEFFDYIIMKNNCIYCFDCKETTLEKWSVRIKDIDQAIALDKIAKLNKAYNCFFLIYFKKSKSIVSIKIDKFNEILKQRKYIKLDDCTNFSLEELLK